MERDQDCGRLCGQGTKGIDLPDAIRQDGIQSIDLLPFQGCHLAEVFSCNGIQGFRIGIQLFLAVCHMYHCQDAEHHPLVPGGQVVQHLLGLFSLQLHIIGTTAEKLLFAFWRLCQLVTLVSTPSSRFWISRTASSVGTGRISMDSIKSRLRSHSSEIISSLT